MANQSGDRSTVQGSGRDAVEGVTTSGPVPDDQEIDVTLVLRRRAELPSASHASDPIDVAELAERYGADPADLQAVRSVVTDAGAHVLSEDPAGRRVMVRGTYAVLKKLFGVELTQARGDSGSFRMRTGELSVPTGFGGAVIAVLGLDDRDQARERFVHASAAATSYTPIQLGEIYHFPAGTDGTDQVVAIIELGGGYQQDDLDAYFTKLGVGSPAVTAVGVDGAENAPTGDANGPDGEVLLDIEVVGALAPKSQIKVYFAPNTDAGFLDAVTEAVHASPAPAAVSISWGQSEDQWTAQARTAMDAAFADAGALGVVVTTAAGDSGSSDSGVGVHCDFPSSSPNALSCGGTSLQATDTTVSSETVWNNGAGRGATGGGVSDAFPVPAYQASVGVPARKGGGAGRGVPDVAGVADPATGYQVRIDGTDTVIGGTSAVAPLWAALTARLVQATGRRFTDVHTTLYTGAVAGVVPEGFRDITSGKNGAYQAKRGWDACTGLGVPVGDALLARLKDA
ncbi:S53 family peptidase [Allobranchiibius sp. GilTou38]|uniref:S53 family peptidase n=1 Tax=Allobranchiibius sp. GilTou38 TaxID=2815210 RepID=UPI001AA125E2|nr:S53 family peptidase [Allobranchiibius sp. GilTou38]MBO1767190.1 S8/S53 family peptidase [Allobranchiibius sp. GilTou38]